MITVISGSNRKNNKTVHFAKSAFNLLKSSTADEIRFLDFSDLDGSVIGSGMYKEVDQSNLVKTIQDTYVMPASKFWFFVPEYNGSYPGIVKLLLDAMSVREIEKSFAEKKACITGIASGRAGNLRGMDHLADVLNHLGIHVHPNKIPISSIFNFLDSKDNTLSKEAIEILQKQISQLLKF